MITVYGADYCVHCKRLKSYLDEKGIGYELRNVEEKLFAKELYDVSGQRSIPVSVIGSRVIVGFDVPQIEGALNEMS